MEFEKLVRPLVEAFVQEFEAALRAQLEARLLGSAAPASGPRRRGRPAPIDASADASVDASVDPSLAPSADAPERASTVVEPSPPVASAPASRTDPTIERVLAFVADNQDRMDDEGEPLRIQPALIASHLGLAPPLVKAVVDHLVTTRKLERRGAGRAAYYTRPAA